MMVVAILALVLVVAAPAIAQVTNAVGQESETGDVNANFSATQSGNNSSQCVTPLQFGNTGSLQNGQAVLQYGSDSGDIELGGSTFTFDPTLNAACNQAVQQSSAASG
jgi:Tfp pilus assembly protein FimT